MRDTDVRPVHPMLEKDYASQWLGVDVVRLGDGHATATMRVREEMLNGFGIAHGGMIFAFADTVFALACNPVDETETITVASGVDINFLSSALPGEILTAVANRTSAAGRSGIYDITVRDEAAVNDLVYVNKCLPNRGTNDHHRDQGERCRPRFPRSRGAL